MITIHRRHARKTDRQTNGRTDRQTTDAGSTHPCNSVMRAKRN